MDHPYPFAPFVHSLKRLLLALSVTCWATIGNAQTAPPTVVTRVPVNVTQASATLRVEVNPNGLDTDVEFTVSEWVFSEGSDKVIRSGIVHAGSGTSPTILEFRVSGLTWNDYNFRVNSRATNSAGSSTGLPVTLLLKPPSDLPKEVDINLGPMVAALPIVNIGERTALIRAEVNPNGLPTSARYYLTYGPESAPINFTQGSVNVPKSEQPVVLEFPIQGLYRGMTYRVMLNASSQYRTNSYHGGHSTFTFTTLGEPGHNPPDIKNVALRVRVGSTESVTRVVEGTDPDGDNFAIESTSAPQHGSVTVDVREWTYTPDATYDGTDQFTVTVIDTTGERATQVVQIYDARPRAFEFELPLGWNVTDPPRPAGKIKLSATASGEFSGRATIFGSDHVFRGTFDLFGEAVVEWDRVGLPPLVANLRLLPGLDGEMHLSAEINAPELGNSYVAEGLPVGDAETTAGVGATQFTVVLPMQSLETLSTTTAASIAAAVASDTPQGDGFLLGKVSRVGRASFVGRTGDGQAFTLGGRLQRNRKLAVGAIAGSQPRDYVVGELEFSRDASKSVGGTLGWLSYRGPLEFYSQDFTRISQPSGAALRKPAKGNNAFGEVGSSTTLTLKLADDSGTPMVDSSIVVNAAGNARTSEGTPIVFHFKKTSGLFRGTIRTTANDPKTTKKFMGAIVQPQKQGKGHVLLNGAVGSVIVSAPEE